MFKFFRRVKDYLMLKRSGLFDEEYYCLQYPDVRQADVNPLWHFVSNGWKESRNPSLDFDSDFYLKANSDVSLAGINPLIHYLKHGRKENRNTQPSSIEPELLTTTLLFSQPSSIEPELLTTTLLFSQPLVSVVIATSNGKETITETLQSVLSQSYKNIEIIIVDDGSKDNTIEVCKILAPNASIYAIDNSGTMAARAFGANKASGEFLFFLDQDDLLFPDCIRKELAFLLDQPEYGLACGNMACIDEKGKELEFNVIPNPSISVYSWENLLLLYPLALSTTLIRMSLYVDIGGWDSRFTYSGALGDTDLFVRVSEVSKIGFMPEIMGKYRWSENRPGRLRSFIVNLAEYIKKYNDHPRLKGIQGAKLRHQFINTCVNYGNHIFDSILREEKTVSDELLQEQEFFYNSLLSTLGKDLERVTEITPVNLSYFNLQNPTVRTIIYKYQIDKEWQFLFKNVALGEPGQFLNWLKSHLLKQRTGEEPEYLKEHFLQIINLENREFISDQDINLLPNHGPDSCPTIVLLYSGCQDILLTILNVIHKKRLDFSKLIIVGDGTNLLKFSENHIHCTEYRGNLFETLKILNKELELSSDFVDVISDTLIIDHYSLRALNNVLKEEQTRNLAFGRIMSHSTLESVSPIAVSNSGSTFINESTPYCLSALGYLRKTAIAPIEYFAFPRRLLETDYFEDITISGKYLLSKEKGFTYQPDAMVVDSKQPVSINSVTTESNLPANWLRSTPVLKILFIDDYIPAIQLGSGFPREQEMLLTLKSLGYFVTFYPVGNQFPFEPDTTILQNAGVEVFHSEILGFTDFLEIRRNLYEIIIISRPHVFSKYVDLIRKYQESAKVIYDAEALFSNREKAKRYILGQAEDNLTLATDENEEIDLMNKADLVISVSENEKNTIQLKKPGLPVVVWGHKQKIQTSRSNFEERKDILFFGSFISGQNSPNEDALLFFAKEIFPLLQNKLNCKLFVVGSSPTQRVLELASPEIVITGFVKDPSEYFNACRVSVVPTRFAAGIPLKLIETFSFGLPTIVSELIANQLQLLNGFHVLIAKDPSDFIEQTILLYRTKWLWNQLWHNSREYLRNNYSDSVMTARLRNIIESVKTGMTLEGSV